MSQKKPNSKAPGPTKNLSYKQIAKIWTELKPAPVLERLRGLQPTARWTASGMHLSACCPYHDESTPSFVVYLDRGYARCFGCEKFVASPIEFWAKITGKSRSEALLDLRQHFGLKFLTGTINTLLEAWDRNQQTKRRIAELCHDELTNAIANPNDPAYSGSQAAVRYLLNTRAIPKDTIPTLDMLGVMPPLAKIYDALNADAVAENAKRTAEAEKENTRLIKVTSLMPDAQAYLQKMPPSWTGAVVFRLDTAPDTIGRLKLRQPDTKQFHFIDDLYDDSLGFFGLGWSLFRNLLGSQHKYVRGAYLVEGEFDALSILARQVEAGGPGFVTVASGGTSGSNQIDTLYNFGFEEINFVSDSSQDHGDDLIKSWLPEVVKLRSRVFVGYDQFPGSDDPDEIIVNHGLDAMAKVFLDTANPAHFATPQDWCFEKATPDLQSLPAADVRQLIERAADWGRLLKNPYECSVFIDSCAQAYGLQPALLKREIVAREENEPAFILRIVDVLSQLFSVVGQQPLDNDRRLYLWHKSTKRIIQVSLADDGSIEREIGTTLGPTYEVFQEEVGIPAFLQLPDQMLAQPHLQKQDQKYRWYLRQALTHMAMTAPDYHATQHRGQGIHAIRDPQGGPPTVYMVNGRDVFVGTYNEHGVLSWKMTDGPVHRISPDRDNTVFDIGLHIPSPPMFDFITNTADLERATTIDARDCYDKLHRILDEGWFFKDHALTVDFLSAHLFSTLVSDSFRRKVFLGLHADSSAGKSRLLMGLIAGTSFPRIHLIAVARGMENYTAAGIRQTTNNSSRPLCLDEFEDEGLGDKKGKTTTEVQEMFRSLTGEGNKYTMGQRGGDPITYTLDYPVFVAAINKARKVQDANRTIGVYLKRVDHRADPQQVLIQTYGVQFFEQLKKDMAIVLLPHIPKLQAAYHEIEIEYGRGTGNKLQLDQRYFEGLYPALAMMKFLGLDYGAFLTNFCEANKESFKLNATYTDSTALFQYICQSPKLTVRGATGERDQTGVMLVQLLANAETRSLITRTNAGLFYDETQQIMVVNWTAAVQVILAQHPKYSRESNLYNLRDLANRAPNAVSSEELASTGVLSRLRSEGIGAIEPGLMTGYRMRDTINTLMAPTALDDIIVAEPPANTAVDAPTGTVYQLPNKKAVHDDNVEFDD